MKVPCKSPTTHFEAKNRHVYLIQTAFAPVIEAYQNSWSLDASARL